MSNNNLFQTLGLPDVVLQSLQELGYENPTPVQEKSIPVLLDGDDLLAQAQTGTGKTAAFALPILAKLNLKKKKTQALILAPTRELAIQVAEAFQRYARYLKGFHVTPIFGGQDYNTQLKALKRGQQVVVGTPGRVMDHLNRKTLLLDDLDIIVLDEADEMLNMGFVNDIEWILEHIPESRQTALFSATMPNAIKKIAKNYQQDAKHIRIAAQKRTVTAITQQYMLLENTQKLDALTRVLEVEKFEAVIIFTRTKTGSSDLAERLQARGYAASALNGDMSQAARQSVINKIKKAQLDIIVATDVAARGIDVERVTHVVNFDIPYDTESYIHRIGRTGRAGRSGKALLFVMPRERRLLKDIEKAIDANIERIDPPSIDELKKRRNQALAADVIATLEKSKKLQPFRDMVRDIAEQNQCDFEDIATVLAYFSQQANPLPVKELKPAKMTESNNKKPSKSKRHKAPPKGRGRATKKPQGKRTRGR